MLFMIIVLLTLHSWHAVKTSFSISLRSKLENVFSHLKENTQSKFAILASRYAPSSVFSMVTLYSCCILANYINFSKLRSLLMCNTEIRIFFSPINWLWYYMYDLQNTIFFKKKLPNKLNQLFLVIFSPFSNCAMLFNLTSFSLSPITFPTQGQTRPK